MIFFVTLSGIITLRKIGGDCLFGHIFAPLSLNNVTNDSLNLYVSYTDFDVKHSEKENAAPAMLFDITIYLC